MNSAVRTILQIGIGIAIGIALDAYGKAYIVRERARVLYKRKVLEEVKKFQTYQWDCDAIIPIIMPEMNIDVGLGMTVLFGAHDIKIPYEDFKNIETIKDLKKYVTFD